MGMQDIQINIIRSARRTLALELRPDGSVLVRAPYRMSRARIMAFVNEKRAWIDSRLRRMRARQEQLSDLEPLTPERLSAMKAEAAADMRARCERYAALTGVDYGRITIRCQRTRWGSCSAGGDLSFNCLLMLAPEPVRDYVAAHELCHRKYMDHSPLFWAEVERVLPDWRERRRWLRENGPALMARVEAGRQN